ncbi:hypothetical protein P7996_15850, partial [Staphylococcus aureus]|nr:hypothetical protein [Staphylococcus aureus]
KELVKYVGIAEATTAALYSASFINKNISRLASLSTIGILSVAEKNDEVIGYINGPVIKERYISDDLFKNVSINNSEGGYISV